MYLRKIMLKNLFYFASKEKFVKNTYQNVISKVTGVDFLPSLTKGWSFFLTPSGTNLELYLPLEIGVSLVTSVRVGGAR